MAVILVTFCILFLPLYNNEKRVQTNANQLLICKKALGIDF
jgi:hypothetical protein